MRTKYKRSLLVCFVAVLLAAAIALSVPLIQRWTADALSSSNVISIYTEANGWDQTNLNAMAVKAGYANFDSLVAAASANKKATDLLHVSNTNTSSAAEWSVKLGNEEFTPVYLSQDVNGNAILTLWQSKASTSRTEYNRTSNNLILRDESKNSPARSNNYATSTLRTLGLNNTGYYYDFEEFVGGRFDEYEYTASTTHQYAMFNTGKLVNYIVSPSDVLWQNAQNTGVNDLANRSDGYYNRTDNHYTSWGEDKLWIPSQYEVLSLWNTTTLQRRDVTHYWARTYSSQVAIGSETNNNWIYSDIFDYNGNSDLGEVTRIMGVRPAFHLNLTAITRKLAPTTGYSVTTYNATINSEMQSAWQNCINNSTSTTYTYSNSSAQVFYDFERGGMTFKLLKDWGANADSGFGTTTGYYDNGALLVPTGKKIVIDLNGHVINRNRYNSTGLSDKGHVIRISLSSASGANKGKLTVIDSSMVPEFFEVDAKGVKGCGRITGGNLIGSTRKTECAGIDGTYDGCDLLIEAGSVCYNKSVGTDSSTGRGGGISFNGNNAVFTMTGGALNHNYCSFRGGGLFLNGNVRAYFYDCIVSYNVCDGIGAGLYFGDSGGAATELTNVTMIGNDCGSTNSSGHGGGGAIFGNGSSSKANSLVVHSGLYQDNKAGAGGFLCLPYGDATINDGMFINNSADSGGAIALLLSSVCTVNGGTFIGNKAIGTAGSSVAKGTGLNGVVSATIPAGDGGGVYMGVGTFTMTGGDFLENSATNTGGGLYLATGTMNLSGGSFERNTAKNYPGFYCTGAINVSGSIKVRNNTTSAGAQQNIYLATDSATLNAVGPLEGAYLGITKTVPSSGSTNVAVGSGYTLGTRDVLCFYSDDTVNSYLFTVNTASNLVFLSKTIHTHTYDDYTEAPTCTQQGYTVNICTGCQEIRLGADGNPIITFTAPTGHNYVWNQAQGAFVCSSCGAEEYISLTPLEDRYPYTQEPQTPLMSGTVYTYDEDGRTIVQHRLTQNHFIYNYENNIELSTFTSMAKVKGTIRNPDTGETFLTKSYSGEHFYPRGVNTGKPAGTMYSYQNKYSGEVQQEFRISLTMTTVNVKTYNMTGGWYITDADIFFSRLSVEASIGKGSRDVTSHGKLTWLVGDEYVDTHPEFAITEEGVVQRFYWKWVPVSDDNLDTTIGYVDVVVQRLIAQKIEVEKINSAVIYDDFTITQIQQTYFEVKATYVKVSGEIARTVVLDSTGYTLQLVDPQTERVYDSVRAGTYNFLFTHNYYDEVITETLGSYTILARGIVSITASLKEGVAVYDSLSNLDDLADYLTVYGITGDGTTREIFGYTMAASNWGAGPGIYNVTITYGGRTTTIAVTVHENKLSKLAVTNWTQTKLAVENYTQVSQLNDYGLLEITATYLDGSSKVIPMAKNGMSGYILSGSLATAGTNKITATYAEVNPFTNMAYAASTTFDVQTETVKLTSASYAVATGKNLFNQGETQQTIADKIVVTGEHNNGTTVNAVKYDGTGTQTVYFDVVESYYLGSSLEFIVNVYEGDVIVTKIFRADTVEVQVSDIKVEVDYTDKRDLLIVDKVAFVKEYLIVSEIYNDGTTQVIPAQNYVLTRTGGEKSTTDGNALSEGRNYFNVTYSIGGKSFSKQAILEVYGIRIESIDVKVLASFADADGKLSEGYLFAGDDYTRFSDYLSVTATYNDGTIKTVDITGYTVEGDFNDAGKYKAFVVKIIDSNSATFTMPFEAYVTPVRLTSITATFVQGDKVIYAITPTSQILENITVEAVYNNGSKQTVTSGFSVAVSGGAFSEEGENVLTVSYEGQSCTASGTVVVTKKAFSHITVESKQGGTVLYASVAYATLADYLTVSAHYNDSSSAPVAYGAEGYALSGDLTKGETLVASYQGSTAEVTGLNITPLLATEILAITNVPSNYYASFGVEALKNYITVTASYNDGVTRIVDKGDYSLSGSLDQSVNTITVTSGVAQPKTFQVTVKTGSGSDPVAITAINSIAINQGSATIYASCDINDLRPYLRITVQLSNGSTAVISQYDFTLSGKVQADGRYTLTAQINGTNITESVPSGLIILPVAPASLSIVNKQTATDEIVAGTALEDVAKYVEVTVINNDGSTEVIEYGESGYLLTGDLIAYDTPQNCTLTVSHGSLTASVTFLVSPKMVQSASVEVTSEIPAVFYSSVFDEADEFVIGKLTAAVKLSEYIVVKRIYNDGSAEVTNAYSFSGGSVKEGTTIAQIKENGGYVTVLVEVAGGTSASFDVYVTAVKPVSITAELKPGAVIYTSASADENIVNALNVTLLYNDESTELLSYANGDFAMYATGNTQNKLIGGEVIYTMYYVIDGDIVIVNGAPVNGRVTVYITPVQPDVLTVTVDTSARIYTTSSLTDVRNALTVSVTNNDGSSKANVTDFELENVVLTASNALPITVSYTSGGKTVSKSVSIKVIEAGVSAISVERNFFDEEGNPVVIYASQTLDVLRNYIIVHGYLSNGDYFGEISNYSLELVEGEVWQAGTVSVRVVFVPTNGGTEQWSGFDVTLSGYELATSQLMLDTEGLEIFEDYTLNDIKDELKSRLYVSATWTDGYIHSNEYNFEVKDITEGASRNRIRVFYSYYAKVGGENVTRDQTIEIPLSSVKIVSITVQPFASYKLYTSDLLSKVVEVTSVKATTNNGKVENKEWTDYEYSLFSNGWENGGSVEVTAIFEVNGQSMVARFNVDVEFVVITAITATYTQTGKLYTSSTYSDILNSGVLVVTGTKSDNTTTGNLTIRTANLSGELVSGDACMITVTYNNGTQDLTTQFPVKIEGVDVESIFAVLTGKVYSNNYIRALSNKLTVTASYTDGSSKEIKYDSYGITGYTLSGTILNPSSDVSTREITVEYSGKTWVLNIDVYPDKLASLSVFYSQKAPVYQNGGTAAIANAPNVLSVIASFVMGGDVVLSASDYQIYNIVDGQKTTTLPASGECTLTVVHVYNNEEYFGTFKVNITEKAAIGIGARFTPSSTVYTTTTLQELVSDVGEVAAKGILEVFTRYNDGSEDEIVVSGGDYTLSGTLTDGNNTIILEYLGYQAEFNVVAEEPQISSIDVSWKDPNFVVYTNFIDSEIKAALNVMGVYNDDHTEQRLLTAVQYSLNSDTSTVGEKVFTVTANSIVTSLNASEDISVTVKQLVSSYNSFQYMFNGEWRNVPSGGLVGKLGGHQMRLTFSAADGSNTLKFIKVSLTEEQWGTTGTYTITEFEVIDNEQGLYVVDSNLSVNLSVIGLKIDSIVAEYSVNEGEKIFTTNTIDELKQKITLKFFYSYNDGSVVEIPEAEMQTYTLEGSLSTAGSNNLVLTYGSYDPIYFQVTAQAPQVTSITVQWKAGFAVQYGYTDEQIKSGLVITGYYDDDGVNRTQPAVQNIASQAILTYTYVDTSVPVPTFRGTYQATVSVKHIEGYINVENVTIDLEVVKAVITSDCIGIIEDKQFADGEIRPMPVVTVNGNVLEYVTDFTCSYQDNVNVGTATVTVEGTGNYTGSATMTFNIVQADNAWVTEPSMANWVFGDLPSEPVGEPKFGQVVFTYEGLNGNDYGETRPSNAGTYYLRATVVEGSNYKSITARVSFEISKANITGCTADDMSWVYDGRPHNIDANTFSATVVPGTQVVWKFSKNAKPVDWGGSNITVLSFLAPSDSATVYYQVSADNHNPIEGSFTVSISKAPLTVKPSDVTVIYGDNIIYSGVTYSGFVGEDTAYIVGGTAEYSTTYQMYSPVGDYAITVSGLTCDRYEITSAEGKLTVIEREVTVTIQNASSQYGAEISNLTASVLTGTIVNDDVAYTLSTVATSTSIVGHYRIEGTSDNANYIVTFVGSNGIWGDYEITPAAITDVSVTGYNGTYAGPVAAVVGEPTQTTQNGMEATWAYSVDVGEEKTYGEMPQFTLIGDYVVYYRITADNHADYYGSFEAAIDKAPLTITMHDIAVPQGKDPVFTYSAEGLVNDENVEDVLKNYTPICSYTTDAVVGAKFVISATATADNYDVSIVSGELLIVEAFLRLKEGSPLYFAAYNGKKLVQIDRETYTGDDTIYLCGIPDSTKWSVVRSHFDNDGDIKAVNYKGAEVKDTAVIGTAAVITLEGDSVTVIIKGDASGDGKANATDLLKIKNHILKKTLLEGAYLFGGDISGDGKANATDLLKLKNHILKKTLLSPNPLQEYSAPARSAKRAQSVDNVVEEVYVEEVYGDLPELEQSVQPQQPTVQQPDEQQAAAQQSSQNSQSSVKRPDRAAILATLPTKKHQINK